MEPEKKSSGAFIGLVIIIIILVIGGIYMWQSNENATEEMNQTQIEEEAVTNQDSAALDALGQDVQKTDTSTGVDANTVQ